MNDNHDQMEPSTQTAGSGADWRTNWTPNRRRFLSLTGLALGGASSASAHQPAAQPRRVAAQARRDRRDVPVPAGETLFVAGFQWGPPKSFNPLAADPDWPTDRGQPTHVRDLDALQSARRLALRRVSPRRCSSLTTTPSRCRCRMAPSGPTGPISPPTTSSSPSSLPRKASVAYSTVWQYIDSVTATDPSTVEFKVKTKPYNPIIVKNFISTTRVVPKAVFGRSRRTRFRLTPTSSQSVPAPSCWTSTTRPRSTSSGTTTTGARPLRYPGDDNHQPPDLQEQQRR